MDARVVLLPDEKTTEITRQYSSLLNEHFSCLFQLDSDHLPHMTLIHIDFADEQLSNIKTHLATIARKTDRIRVTTSDAGSGSDSKGYIGMYFSDDQPILLFRAEIHTELNPLVTNVSSYNPPHVTFTRLRDDNDAETALALLKDFPKQEFLFDRLAICKTAENGVCTEIIASFPLT